MFQCDTYDEDEAVRAEDGTTHIVALAGAHDVAFCGASVKGGHESREGSDVDCMTCIVFRDRFVAGLTGLGQ